MTQRKGVLDIEFMLSIFLFLTVLSFVSFTLINTIPKLHQETFSQDIKSKAFQVSEMLLFDSGWPTTWESGGIDDVKRLGISNGKRYYLDSDKLTTLRSYCLPASMQVNYEKIKKLFGLDYRNDISIELSDGVTDINCGPTVISRTRAKAMITRMGVDDSTSRVWIIMVSVL